jgi:Tol biopolymer transport system component
MSATRIAPRTALALAALAAIVTGGVFLLPAARGAFPGKPGLIVFDDSSQSGGGESESDCVSNFDAIKTMRPSGRRRTFLRRGIDPAFSPDGRKIAFGVCDGVQGDVMVMDSDGGGAHAVLDTSVDEYQPAFSADGKRLFFVRDAGGEGYGNIYSVGIDGTGLKRLTPKHGEIAEHNPQAAANGRFVVFERSGRILTMRPDGSHEKRLAFGHDPAISPDSRRIAYADGGQIFLIGPGGRHRRPLTHLRERSDALAFALSPAFSPNGRWVAFAVERCVDYGPGCHDSQKLAKARVRDGKVRPLTTTKVGGFHPDWQPRS